MTKLVNNWLKVTWRELIWGSIPQSPGMTEANYKVSFKTDGLRAGFEVRTSGIRSSYCTHFTMTSGIIT